ncbi:MAG: DUF368 domain-containing protein [Myxococcota bacterium]
MSPLLVVRGAIGGALMGLANLVPGISGGTMLLAAGVYPDFIGGIAEITTLRFRARSLVLLASIVAAAALAILMLAGQVRDLVIHHRYLMYSLFIGLTLGGVPLIWRMLRPATGASWLAAGTAFALMCVMALSGGVASGGDDGAFVLLFLSGLAASSAMILPGVSGGYLLLLLGQYETILGSIDLLKSGLLGGGEAGLAAILDALEVVLPLGLGVVVGVVGVSNLLRWLLARYEKATLGALLGLLLGAVVGLWPFLEARAPEPGESVDGIVVTQSNQLDFDREDWPLARFDPSAQHMGLAALMLAAGLLGTTAVGRVGKRGPEEGRRWA